MAQDWSEVLPAVVCCTLRITNSILDCWSLIRRRLPFPEDAHTHFRKWPSFPRIILAQFGPPRIIFGAAWDHEQNHKNVLGATRYNQKSFWGSLGPPRIILGPAWDHQESFWEQAGTKVLDSCTQSRCFITAWVSLHLLYNSVVSRQCAL